MIVCIENRDVPKREQNVRHKTLKLNGRKEGHGPKCGILKFMQTGIRENAHITSYISVTSLLHHLTLNSKPRQ